MKYSISDANESMRLQPAAASGINPGVNSWPVSRKVFFRFSTLFFILFIFPFPFDSIPFLDAEWYYALWENYTNVWHAIVPWFSRAIHLYDYPVTTFSNGSGDTSYDYALTMLQILIASAGTIIWSVADRRRPSYNTAYYLLRTVIRYFLCFCMLSYGFSKIFHNQMPGPRLSDLVKPLGEKSPMGLAWTYLGFSKGFSVFTGIAEVCGGILLLFRRTVNIGTVLIGIVMANVVLINIFFDVPVKLFSAALLLMSVFLLEPVYRILLNVFWFKKSSSEFKETSPVFLSPQIRIGSVAIKWIFFTALLLADVKRGYENRQKYGDAAKKSPLYGIYNISQIKTNDTIISLLFGDSTHWKQFIVDNNYTATIRLLNDSARKFSCVTDTSNRSIRLFQGMDTASARTYQYSIGDGILALRSADGGTLHSMLFDRYDENKFPLINTPFRWINERPFNR